MFREVSGCQAIPEVEGSLNQLSSCRASATFAFLWDVLAYSEGAISFDQRPWIHQVCQKLVFNLFPTCIVEQTMKSNWSESSHGSLVPTQVSVQGDSFVPQPS